MPTCSTTRASSGRTSAPRSARSTTTAAGVPLTVNLTVLDSSSGYAALEGVAVYAWHADAQGRYSMYSSAASRTRTTCAACSRRTPRAPRASRPSSPGATTGGGRTSTSRCTAAPPRRRATGRSSGPARSPCPRPPARRSTPTPSTYPSSASNLARTSLTRDMVFGDDGGIHQLATVTGDAASGFVANLTIGVLTRGGARGPVAVAIGSPRSPSPRGGAARPRPGRGAPA